MGKQDSLTIATKQHEVSFPVTGNYAVENIDRSVMNGNPLFHMVNGTAAALAEPATPGFVTGQEAVPIVFLGRAMIGEPVNGFVRDNTVTLFEGESPCDLFGGPALLEAVIHMML